QEFPYRNLKETSRSRTREDFEDELPGARVFDAHRYFDVFIECASKAAAMSRLLVVLLLAAVLSAQSSEPSATDPMGRMTPQDAIFQFLEACHRHEYSKAAHYLDLRQISPADLEKEGPQLAQQLEDLLDDTPFDIATLSRSPEGDLSDGHAPSRD